MATSQGRSVRFDSARSWAALLGSLLSCCVDASEAPPNPPSTQVDSDADGLCDAQEVARRTSPFDIDTDGDGISDLAEVRIGSNPNRVASPTSSEVTLVRPSSDPQVLTLTTTVFGRSEDFRGEVLRIAPFDRPVLATLSADFVFSNVAVGADPERNVASFADNVFVRVEGETTLAAAVEFRPATIWLSQPPSCIDYLPFTYVWRRVGGSMHHEVRRVIALVPDDAESDRDPTRDCRPMRCI